MPTAPPHLPPPRSPPGTRSGRASPPTPKSLAPHAPARSTSPHPRRARSSAAGSHASVSVPSGFLPALAALPFPCPTPRLCVALASGSSPTPATSPQPPALLNPLLRSQRTKGEINSQLHAAVCATLAFDLTPIENPPR